MEKGFIIKEQRQMKDREKTFAAYITSGGFLFLRQGTSTNIWEMMNSIGKKWATDEKGMSRRGKGNSHT